MADVQQTSTPSTGIDSILSQMMKMQGPSAGETKALGDISSSRAHLSDVLGQPKPVMGPTAALPQRPQTGNADVMQAFAQPASIIAIFGSLLTRRPMTAAIKAAAAAMQGYSQGNQEAVDRAEKSWRDNLTVALQQNQMEIDRYRAAIDAHKDDINAALAEITAASTEFHDEVALQQAKSGNLASMAQIIESRARMGEAAQNHADMMQLRRDQMDAMAMYREQQIGLKRETLGLAKDRLGQVKEYQAAQVALGQGRLEVAKGQLDVGQRRLQSEVTYHQQQMAQKQHQFDALEKDRSTTAQLQRDRLSQQIKFEDSEIKQRQDQLKSLNDYRDTMTQLATTRVTDMEAYHKATLALSRERLDVTKGKTAGTAEAKSADLQSLSEQLASLTDRVNNNPSLVGAKGLIRRTYGEVAGQVSSSQQDPQAARFASDLEALQAKLVKPFLDAHYFSGPSATRLDELVRGLGVMDDPTSAVQSFSAIKDIIDGQVDTINAAAADVRSSALYSNAPPIGTIDGNHQFNGGDPADPGSWSTIDESP